MLPITEQENPKTYARICETMNLFSYISGILVAFVAFSICPTSVSAFFYSSDQQTTVKEQTKETPVKILYKPKPSRRDGTDCSVGTVILRIEFLKTGEIGKIYVVKGITENRNEASIEAAKGIKFRPATKDGENITLYKQVEFSFSFY